MHYEQPINSGKSVKKLSCALLFIFGIINIKIAAEEPMTSEQIIKAIAVSEAKVRDIQASVEVTEVGTEPVRYVFKNWRWCYDRGKEYMEYNELDEKQETISHVMHAFDGKAFTSLRANVGYPHKLGGIQGFDKFTFNANPTPKQLLGYSTKFNGHETFSESISSAESLSLREKKEIIDGHECFVVEAIGMKDGENKYDIVAYIDSERDYRPLKIDSYYSVSGKNHLKVIASKIEGIKLLKVGEIWFPIEGERTVYNTEDILMPEGLTDEQAQSLSKEELQQQATFIQSPIAKPKRIKIDCKSLKINEGIPTEKFRITFPQGCRVWDDFLQTGYVVGGRDKDNIDSLPLSENLNKNHTKNKPDSQINFQRDTDVGPQVQSKTNPNNIQTRTLKSHHILLLGFLVTGLVCFILLIVCFYRGLR